MDLCPIQGESKILIRLTLEKTEISVGFMGYLARKAFRLLQPQPLDDRVLMSQSQGSVV